MAGGITATALILWTILAINYWGNREARPVAVIVDNDHILLGPGEVKRFNVSVSRPLNFGFLLESDTSRVRGILIEAKDWDDWIAGKSVKGWYGFSTDPPPDWINGGGGIEPGEYAYGLRCLEKEVPCDAGLRLELWERAY